MWHKLVYCLSTVKHVATEENNCSNHLQISQVLFPQSHSYWYTNLSPLMNAVITISSYECNITDSYSKLITDFSGNRYTGGQRRNVPLEEVSQSFCVLVCNLRTKIDTASFFARLPQNKVSQKRTSAEELQLPRNFPENTFLIENGDSPEAQHSSDSLHTVSSQSSRCPFPWASGGLLQDLGAWKWWLLTSQVA